MIRLAILENNIEHRLTLQTALQGSRSISIVVHTETGADWKNLIKEAKPDVVLVSTEEPGEIEGGLIHQIYTAFEGLKIMVWTSLDNEECIIKAIKDGAVGYLVKTETAGDIIPAIEKLYDNKTAVSDAAVGKIIEYIQQSNRNSNLELFNLTKREKQVLDMLLNGLSYKEIAKQNFISINTVFTHTNKIYNKLGIHSRSELAARFNNKLASI